MFHAKVVGTESLIRSQCELASVETPSIAHSSFSSISVVAGPATTDIKDAQIHDRFDLSAKGKLVGRVITEALRGGAAARHAMRVLRSEPSGSSLRTLMQCQMGALPLGTVPSPDCRYDPGRTPEAPSSALVNCAPMAGPARLHCSPEPSSSETSGADRHDRPRFRAPPGLER